MLEKKQKKKFQVKRCILRLHKKENRTEQMKIFLTRQLNADKFSEPANRKPRDKQAPAMMQTCACLKTDHNRLKYSPCFALKFIITIVWGRK